MPAELAFDLAGVDGVAAVVAGAVGDEGDELAPARSRGAHLVEQVADGLDDLEVRALVAAADVVGLAGLALFGDESEGLAMVADVEPVADVLAVAVDGERLPLDGVEDHQRDELFGELVRAV